jgi:ATP adenylyltransferase
MKCNICSQLEGKSEDDVFYSSVLKRWGRYVPQVIPLTRNYAAIPSLGPLAQGHMLIVPRIHAKSMYSLAVNLIEELEEATEILAWRMKEKFNCEVFQFEHGNDPAGARVSCSVEHAHLHIVPLHADPITHEELETKWIPFPEEPLRACTILGNAEYLLIRTLVGRRYFQIAPEFGFESQLMRKRISEKLGQKDSWNWRKDFMLNEAIENYLEIK